MSEDKLVLASMSPRRREMFEQLGIDVDIIPADIDESLLPGEQANDYVKRVSFEKGLSVATRLKNEGRTSYILAADTAVVLDGQILGKPIDDEDAIRMLTTLSGKTHKVITGYALGKHEDVWTIDSVSTDVTFYSLSKDEIEKYVASGEGRDKAGSYGIQEKGVLLVRGIEGDYFNIVGLPIAKVVRLLAEKQIARGLFK